MAIYLSEFNVSGFRGITDLEVTDLGHVNIIVGDNNCGKTSVLEALLLFKNPNDFNNILRVARARDASMFFRKAPVYENFINLFPKKNNLSLGISGIYRKKNIEMFLKGDRKKIMVDMEELSRKMNDNVKRGFVFNEYNAENKYNGEIETETFFGKLTANSNDAGITETVDVEFSSYSSVTGREIQKKDFINIVYVSPTDHVSGNIFSRIIKNDVFKDICIHVLQLFDKDIIDLVLLKNEDTSFSVEYIKHKKLGNMPLSTYGDGIKKVLSIANGIAMAQDGILLIDEIDTAIHTKYYDDIFLFIFKACMQFNVQLFVTTHSIEAVDGLLATQNYSEDIANDNIRVITFRKDRTIDKTYSRVLTGKEVVKNRSDFNFEVRI